MVRFPRSWGKAPFHPQARRGPSMLAYRPGYAGSGMQPRPAIPLTRYQSKITGVPLTGGQALGQIGGWQAQANSVTSPGAYEGIIVLLNLVPGTYTVNWTVILSGSLSSSDTNNFALYSGPTFIASSVNTDAPGSYPQTPVTLTVTAAAPYVILFCGPNAGTSGSVYGATMAADIPVLTLAVAPQGIGTVWYPVQVTLSTTTGVLDASTALVYLGSGNVPNTLVATVYSGNGTVALAIPDMSPGQSLVVQWFNGHPGDTAAFNIIGTMDALTTG